MYSFRYISSSASKGVFFSLCNALKDEKYKMLEGNTYPRIIGKHILILIAY